MRQYIDYIIKTRNWLNKLAKDENLSRCWVYYDYALAVLKHRCLIRQYVIGEFWRASNAERKRRLTYNRIVKLFGKLTESMHNDDGTFAITSEIIFIIKLLFI